MLPHLLGARTELDELTIAFSELSAQLIRFRGDV